MVTCLSICPCFSLPTTWLCLEVVIEEIKKTFWKVARYTELSLPTFDLFYFKEFNKDRQVWPFKNLYALSHIFLWQLRTFIHRVYASSCSNSFSSLTFLEPILSVYMNPLPSNILWWWNDSPCWQIFPLMPALAENWLEIWEVIHAVNLYWWKVLLYCKCEVVDELSLAKVVCTIHPLMFQWMSLQLGAWHALSLFCILTTVVGVISVLKWGHSWTASH